MTPLSPGVAVPVDTRQSKVTSARNRDYEVAVVVPTFNEAQNVHRIVDRLDAALNGLSYEILFVDDWSTDGTAAAVEEVARHRADVRVLRRFGRRGLSSAVIEGMMATMAPIVAVIDGDGQHDESILPLLVAKVNAGDADVAIGSRYCALGSVGSWNVGRQRASQVATRLSRLVLRTAVDDPMSGFFVIRRRTVQDLLPLLSGRGFKILFDLLSASPDALKVVELPYEFREREHGSSKLGFGVTLDYGVMIADRLIRRFVPSRPALFAAVGALGLIVHLAVLKMLLSYANWPFAQAQTGAVFAAITFNFALNNSITFRDRRLQGRDLLLGLVSFYVICGLGAVANVGTGTVLFAAHRRWWVSGVAGAVIGSLWNFAASSLVTWRRR